MPRKPKYSVFMRHDTFMRVLKSIPCELHSMFGLIRDSMNEHLVEAWLTGGKERYEKTGNPFAKPKYMKPPPLFNKRVLRAG